MTNAANHGVLIGRLSQDIKQITNRDGSVTQLITLAVDDDYKSGPDKKVQTNFIPLRDFVRAGGTNLWGGVHKGDLIAVPFRISAKPYEKDGKTEYPLSLETDGAPRYLEPKTVTEARAAKAAAAAPEAADEIPATVPADTSATGESIEELQAKLAALQAQG